MARKDYSKLVKKVVTDKDGKRRTVWVKRDPKKPKGSDKKLKDLELKKLKLMNQALGMFSNSPAQLKVRKQIDKVNAQIEKLKSGKDSSKQGDDISRIDKEKTRLLKEAEELSAKYDKLYGDADIESPMSDAEKKMKKDIAALYSEINQLVRKKRKMQSS